MSSYSRDAEVPTSWGGVILPYLKRISFLQMDLVQIFCFVPEVNGLALMSCSDCFKWGAPMQLGSWTVDEWASFILEWSPRPLQDPCGCPDHHHGCRPTSLLPAYRGGHTSFIIDPIRAQRDDNKWVHLCQRMGNGLWCVGLVAT